VAEAPDARRKLPQIDRLTNVLADEFDRLPRAIVVDAVRTVVDVQRKRARRTKTVPAEEEVVAMCRDELRRRQADLLVAVVNATGVILHTNLGRAPLSPAAIDAVVRIASGYSNLEWDVGTGRRGDRYVHVEPLLATLCATQAALVVNNNAAAVLLVCTALAAGREVVISRGELIEIGGEFRIPDILVTSGATLREVGTTNRTHLRDYERAIGENTAFVLVVHPSNYRVVGFTKTPSVTEIAAVAHRRRVPLVFDAGSGLVARTLADEPVVTEAVDAGADLVCFSGDKLFGGPQAGIVVGTSDLIAPLRSHPLLRALRPDKMQLAALGATVMSYLRGDASDLPVNALIDADVSKRSRRLAKVLVELGFVASVVRGESVAGGGSLPGHGIETDVVRVTHPTLTAAEIAAALRAWSTPVVVRVDAGAVVVDLRTVAPAQDGAVKAAFASFR
jgi:L-seryl-tRNA(Ser) seleniumtransferase